MRLTYATLFTLMAFIQYGHNRKSFIFITRRLNNQQRCDSSYLPTTTLSAQLDILALISNFRNNFENFINIPYAPKLLIYPS